MVFEVRGAVSAFAAAIRKVPGLELIDEEELESDQDKNPALYLLMPDVRALRELASLWERWLQGRLGDGYAAWRSVFSLLRDLRPWGPQDRVMEGDARILKHEIEGREPDELVRLELELVYRSDGEDWRRAEDEVRRVIAQNRGQVVTGARLEDIGYHALLVDLPTLAVQTLVSRSHDGIAGLEQVMHVRPQSTVTTLEIGDVEESGASAQTAASGEPILALIDGVPVAQHRLLAKHLLVDDQFGLEPTTPVADRVHGTAMASLIVHGDRNKAEPTLLRPIHAVPVLGAGERFPPDRLIVDMIYSAIVRMRAGPQATAPHVLLVNLSLGNARRPFQGPLSPWARLLDRLAYQYGLLFIVSAGNCGGVVPIAGMTRRTDFEDAHFEQRAEHTLRALHAIMADRRLLSPSETVNGITVGAANEDAVQLDLRKSARVNVDPYGDMRMANPSSALGPGFARSIKPDLLLPGAREHLFFQGAEDNHLLLAPARPNRTAGLKVAAPPRDGMEGSEAYTGGTSAAAALGARTAHRIHDALERAYGETFLQLSSHQRAVLLKALLAHSASWPDQTAAWIRNVVGPSNNKLHVQQKDNIRRFLGYGMVDPENAIACADDRATFWATGTLEPQRAIKVSVPVPAAMNAKPLLHLVVATLAWFTPILPGRRSYRAVRLELRDPAELGALQINSPSNQPDAKQARRGTLLTRRWQGDRAPAIGPNMTMDLSIQREPDQGVPFNDPIPFGLAVTLTMPGVLEIYEQARARLGIQPRART